MAFLLASLQQLRGKVLLERKDFFCVSLFQYEYYL